MMYFKRTLALAFIVNTLVPSVAFAQVPGERSQAADGARQTAKSAKNLSSPAIMYADSDSFRDLQFSLLSISHGDYAELFSDLEGHSTESESGTRTYLLDEARTRTLDAMLLKSAARKTVDRFHTYRVAGRIADYHFGELPFAGQDVDTRKMVAKLKFETDKTRDGNRQLAGQFLLVSAPDKPIDVEFSFASHEGSKSRVGYMIAVPAEERVWLLTLGTKRSQHESQALMYQVHGRFIEFSDRAMAEIRESLSVDSTRSAAWVLSEADSSSLDVLATAKISAGSARIVSRPRMIGIAGQSMTIQIGSEVPISVAAGEEFTDIESITIGTSLDVTLTALTAGSDRLHWKLGITGRDGDSSFVTRNISGASVRQAGESIVIPLPIQNDGMHLVAVLNVSRVDRSPDGSVTDDLQSINPDQQFAELTEEFNKLMTARRYAEAIRIGEQAVELQPENPAAVIMVEKANLQNQVAIFEKDQSEVRAGDGQTDRLETTDSLVSQPDDSMSVVIAESADAEQLPGLKASDSECDTFDIQSNGTVRCVIRDKVKLKHTSRIKEVSDFDSSVLKVEPAQSDARCIFVRSLAEGGTQMRIVDEHDAEYFVNFLSLQFSGLDVYLKHLFPTVAVEVWPIRDSVLLRGAVKSELQRQHVVAVAEQFYPSILDQLTIRPDAASSPLSAQRQRSMSDDLMSRSTIKIAERNASLILPRNCTKTLVFPNQIRSVDFNDQLIYAERVGGAARSIFVHALANGTTKITATKLTAIDENDQRYVVDIVVEDSVRQLGLLARRLYPDLDLSFFSVKGAILVRGAVESEIQIQQILAVAQQFAPLVLDQTHIVAGAAADTHTVRPGKDRQTVLDTNGVQAVRSDIRVLHRDVRDLIEILKARKAKDSTR